ncbi:MAG: type IX secretion system membrane protein PorP/SprF [Saprospiraceae bacterium]|nr:type IX secretion system membrane protein PorP/SprF [Saprospiraceae bacterium]
MKYFFTPIIVYLSFVTAALAQQAPQYSLFMLNPYATNPAYAGLENTLVATGVYRQQWSGLKGGPVTQHINAHLPVYVIHSGVGLKIENDAIGAHRTTQVLLSYNYQIELGRSALLSLGASAGYMQYALDGDKLRAPQGTYAEPGGIFTHNDDYLPEGKVQAGTPIFEVGVYLQARSLEVGVAIQPVFAPVLQAGSDGSFQLQPVRQYLFSAMYTIGVGENVKVKPSVLLRSDARETQMEFSTLIRWRENIFLGGSFRGFTRTAKDAAVLLAGLKINEKATLAYAFDIPLSPLNTVNRGSHELLLRYSLNQPIGAGKLPPVIYNPRFF